MRRLAAIALLIFLGLFFTFYHPSHALVEDSDELSSAPLAFSFGVLPSGSHHLSVMKDVY